MNLENTILSNLVFNEDYVRRTIHFLTEDYFRVTSDKTVFNIIKTFFEKYNKPPTREALFIELDGIDDIDETVSMESHQKITDFKADSNDIEWLVDTTEKWCQDRAIHNAVREAILILEKDDGKGDIPKLLQEALGVSFDAAIGHDYFKDAEDRFKFYTNVETKLPFNIEMLNRITNGGIEAETLNVFMAATHAGKTAMMTHMASGYVMDGKKALYITLEMSEEKIPMRVDANLMNITLDDLLKVDPDVYAKKIRDLRAKTVGELKVKQYPTASAHVGHFRHLLNELRLKENYIPDVVFIDYLNICASSRYKPGANVNSYERIKSVAEELRGLAVEMKLPIVTATQVNRAGYQSSDLDMDDTSESFGLPMTADFMIAMVATEELKELNQVSFKQLKNRYRDVEMNKRFVIGFDRPHMRFYDVESDAQDLNDRGQDTVLIESPERNTDRLRKFL